MASEQQQPHQTLVAALARNRGELDPARLTALLERLGTVTGAKPAPAPELPPREAARGAWWT